MHLSASRTSVAAAGALVFLCCASSSRLRKAPSEGGYPWFRVQSPRFRLDTDLDSDDAVHLSAELERFRGSLAEGASAHDDGTVVRVIAFRSAEELWEFTPRQLSGFMNASFDDPLIVFEHNAPWDWETGRNVPLHELTHVFIQAAYPSAPSWYHEGMASYFESAHVEWFSDEVVVGRSRADLDRRVRVRGRLSLEDLWNWPNSVTGSEEAMARHYASAWLWISFLRHRHRTELAVFEAALASGRDARSSFDAAFSDSAPSLWQELGDYMNRIPFVERFNAPLQPTRPVVSSLSDGDYRALRALVASRAPNRSDRRARAARVLKEADAALANDPNQVDALVLRAEWIDSRQERRAAAERCTEIAPDNPRCWVARAQSGDPSALDRARALAPHGSGVLALVADRAAAEGRFDEAQSSEDELARIRPWAPLSHSRRARILAAAGRCPEAQQALQRGVDLAAEANLGPAAQAFAADRDAVNRACAH